MSRQKQYLLVGYPFSGKTTLAKELEKRLGFVRLNVDEIKQEFGYGNVTDDKVSDESWETIFKELDKRIEESLKLGKIILNEYAWISRAWRDRARNLASKLGIETIVIFVDTPEDIVRERRIKNKNEKTRFDVSDADFDESIRNFEKPINDENVIVYKNGENLDEWIQRLN
jgi:predicted kinase